MDELLIREVLIFGGAVAGAAWGYYLGKIIERRRFEAEVKASLQAIERWAMDVCHGLDDLEHSLGRMGHFAVSEASADLLVDASAAPQGMGPASSPGQADEAALKRFLSRVTNRA